MNEKFNLAPPPNFRGLDPGLPIHIYQRHLPHWRQSGATYFVTFRLTDSIPQKHLAALMRWRERWEQQTPEPRSEEDWKFLAKEVTTKTERYLDEGYGACELQQPPIMELMSDSLLKFHQERYCNSCFAVMPNHTHVIIKPLGNEALEDILRNMKGYVARRTNQMLNRTGTLWAEESYDRIIRDEEHLWRVVQYIGKNGRNAGLQDDAFLRWIDPEWIQSGWDFVDPAPYDGLPSPSKSKTPKTN